MSWKGYYNFNKPPQHLTFVAMVILLLIFIIFDPLQFLPFGELIKKWLFYILVALWGIGFLWWILIYALEPDKVNWRNWKNIFKLVATIILIFGLVYIIDNMYKWF